MKLVLNPQTKPQSVTLVADDVVIWTVNDSLDLLGNASYLGAQHIIARQCHFADEFFDLSTRLAGDILQKFANYRVKLTIEGEWREINSRALRDFIRECNRGEAIEFLNV
ncbi:DUF4180 domain-containing protein [Reinekea sp. G2M2-21]|uniref:DUF4180 domain-containing protein n=1 Tax=Reinekea sp. G2M2-21 TaxID=2788942 RepID=UPI0018AB92B1|nr:DUF4180 domain-containing protein [Reinekea sp.]MDX1474797.1 DUF4180 domain-containing protein [Reinekea sp.]